MAMTRSTAVAGMAATRTCRFRGSGSVQGVTAICQPSQRWTGETRERGRERCTISQSMRRSYVGTEVQQFRRFRLSCFFHISGKTFAEDRTDIALESRASPSMYHMHLHLLKYKYRESSCCLLLYMHVQISTLLQGTSATLYVGTL